MKLFIGTSLGKCVKSILDGTVNESDVFVIVTNTNCPTLDRLLEVIDEYYYGRTYVSDYDMSAHSIEDARELATRLFEQGRLHQPRAVGESVFGNAHTLKDTWYEINPSLITADPQVLEAYGHYRMMAALKK